MRDTFIDFPAITVQYKGHGIFKLSNTMNKKSQLSKLPEYALLSEKVEKLSAKTPHGGQLPVTVRLRIGSKILSLGGAVVKIL